jgi:hypothetical protein
MPLRAPDPKSGASAVPPLSRWVEALTSVDDAGEGWRELTHRTCVRRVVLLSPAAPSHRHANHGIVLRLGSGAAFLTGAHQRQVRGPVFRPERW